MAAMAATVATAETVVLVSTALAAVRVMVATVVLVAAVVTVVAAVAAVVVLLWRSGAAEAWLSCAALAQTILYYLGQEAAVVALVGFQPLRA